MGNVIKTGNLSSKFKYRNHGYVANGKIFLYMYHYLMYNFVIDDKF